MIVAKEEAIATQAANEAKSLEAEAESKVRSAKLMLDEILK